MKTILFGGSAALLGWAAYSSDAFRSGTVYPMPVDLAYAKLAHMDLPDEFEEFVRRTPGVMLEVDREPGKSVTWQLKQQGHLVAEVEATLSAEDAGHTRVAVSFESGDLASLPGVKGDVAAAQNQLKNIEMLPLVQDVGHIALQEQVAATLEGRKFDQRKMAYAVTAYVASHPAAVAEYGQAMSQMSQMASARLEAERENRNGAAEPNLGGSGPMMSTKPMTDLSKYK